MMRRQWTESSVGYEDIRVGVVRVSTATFARLEYLISFLNPLLEARVITVLRSDMIT